MRLRPPRVQPSSKGPSSLEQRAPRTPSSGLFAALQHSTRFPSAVQQSFRVAGSPRIGRVGFESRRPPQSVAPCYPISSNTF